MNDLAHVNGGALANAQPNFFEEYGKQASQKGSIVGSLLKFSKGDYTIGDNEDVPVGTQLIANMSQLLVGWVRWSNNKPTDQLMGAVMEGFQPARRNTLGDTDEGDWEVDPGSNKPKDPWQLTNYLLLRELDRPDDGGLLTFATSSRGGINAIGELSKAYGKVMAQKPKEWPIIQLGVTSYTHDKFGKIKVPVFDIVGWASRSSFENGAEAASGGSERATTNETPATAATKF